MLKSRVKVSEMHDERFTDGKDVKKCTPNSYTVNGGISTRMYMLLLNSNNNLGRLFHFK